MNDISGPDWKRPPFEHQRAQAQWHYTHLNSLDASDLGVGKTAPMIHVLNGLIWSKRIDRVLVVATNTILDNWTEELNAWSDLTYVILRGKKEKRLELLKDLSKHVYLINYEGIRVVYPWLSKQIKQFDIIVCDEIHHIKSYNATQTQLLLKLAQGVKSRKGMTGTIITNDLQDVWAIAQFIDPSIFRCNEWGFKGRYLYDQNQVTCRVENNRWDPYVKIFFSGVVAQEIVQELEKAGFQAITNSWPLAWQAERNDKTSAVGEDFRHRSYLKFPKLAPKIGAVEEVKQKLSKVCIRFEKREVLKFLPPVLFEKRYIDLSPEQAKFYKDLKRHFVAELMQENCDYCAHPRSKHWGTSQDSVNAVCQEMLCIGCDKYVPPQFAALQILERVNKLQQVCSGFVYRKGEPTYRFEKNAKLDCLRDLLKEIGDKRVCIWAAFTEDVRIITELLMRDFVGNDLNFSAITGETKAEDRQPIVNAFNKGELRYLIANPSCAGEGLNIFTPYAIYYSRGYKLGERIQSLGRHHRPGAEIFANVTILDLVCRDTVEIDVLAALDDKQDLLRAVNPESAMGWFK